MRLGGKRLIHWAEGDRRCPEARTWTSNSASNLTHASSTESGPSAIARTDRSANGARDARASLEARLLGLQRLHAVLVGVLRTTLVLVRRLLLGQGVLQDVLEHADGVGPAGLALALVLVIPRRRRGRVGLLGLAARALWDLPPLLIRTPNRPRTYRGTSPARPQIDTASTPDRPKIEPRVTLSGPQIDISCRAQDRTQDRPPRPTSCSLSMHLAATCRPGRARARATPGRRAQTRARPNTGCDGACAARKRSRRTGRS